MNNKCVVLHSFQHQLSAGSGEDSSGLGHLSSHVSWVGQVSAEGMELTWPHASYHPAQGSLSSFTRQWLQSSQKQQERASLNVKYVSSLLTICLLLFVGQSKSHDQYQRFFSQSIVIGRRIILAILQLVIPWIEIEITTLKILEDIGETET